MRAGTTRRLIALAALSAASMLLGPSACLFPNYTFDLGATGGSGGSPSSSSSSSSGMGGTGGTPPPVEDCLNGVDDNDDGKVDCEDPQCQVDYECVDPVPTGWGSPGYVALYEGAFGQTAPDCPDDMPAQVYTGNATLNAQQAICSACSCSAPTGQDCQLTKDLNPAQGLQPMQVSNMPCGMSATQLTALTVPDPPWGGACYHDEVLPGGQLCNNQPCNTSVQSSVPTISGGKCDPTGGVATRPPVKWVTQAAACHGTREGKGCSGAQICMPKPQNPFKPHVCVEKPGDVDCPVGTPFQFKNVYYTDVDDTRDCTACSCGAASGGSCEITISLWGDTTIGVCTTPVASFKAGQCTNLTGNPDIHGRTDQVTKAPTGGSCQPAGASNPTGQVTEKNPTTFCCL